MCVYVCEDYSIEKLEILDCYNENPLQPHCCCFLNILEEKILNEISLGCNKAYISHQALCRISKKQD